MAFSLLNLQTSSIKIDRSSALVTRCSFNPRFSFALKHVNKEVDGRGNLVTRSKTSVAWSFIGGTKIIPTSNLSTLQFSRKSSGVYVSCLASSETVANVFTLGTAAVLPFYVLMVLAPKSDLTKKLVESNVPYIVLGLVYAHLLCSSWTDETIKLLFTSKYLLPELPGIAKMFSSETTLASAWIHLLTVDLYAARQVFRDGVKNDIETRHSVILCLFFCPIGIVSHVITRLLGGGTFKQEP